MTVTVTSLLPSLLTISLFIVLLVFQQSYWLYWWQLKEYRIDRMRDWLSTVSGRRAMWNTTTGLTILAVAMTPLLNDPWLFSVVLLILIYEWNNKRVRPVLTQKAIVILIGSSLTIMTGTAIAIWWWKNLTPLAPVLLLIPLIITMWVAIMAPITRWQKQRIMRAAKQRIDTLRPIVIGITGSYGKSTTKEFLRTILESHFRVLSTPKNINVDIGVAQILLSELKSDHEICIIEMGAYRTGEIASICDLVSPTIGILTAIRPQHLSLFGSLEAIKDAKSELLQSLPATGHAIINGDQDTCRAVADRSPAPITWYSTQASTDVWAEHILVTPDTITFELHIGNEHKTVTASLHGEQVVGSLLAAAAAASAIGLSITDIVTGLHQVTAPQGTMSLITTPTGVTLIDDHYNSNPDAFMAALDYLSLFTEQKKIVITPGMIELGIESETHHQAVGGQIARIADLLIITKDDFAAPLRAGAIAAGMPEQAIVVNDHPETVIRDHLQTLTNKDVVLIEGRAHKSIIDYLKNMEAL